MRKSSIANLVAAILIAAMFVANIYECVRYLEYSAVNSNDNSYLIEESFENEFVYADGKFDGDNSDRPVTDQDGDTVPEPVNIPKFNILEIIPNEHAAVIGHMIGGFEPIYELNPTTNNPTMNEACMDAMVNKTPGRNSDNEIPNDLRNMNAQIGGIPLFTFNNSYGWEGGDYYTGYYKKVEPGQGVYAIAIENGHELVDPAAKTATMVSKYYSSVMNNTGNFDYIWVYDNDPAHVEEGDTAERIICENHWRKKYTNNEKFFKELYPQPDIEDFKKTHYITVTSRSPENLTEDDIKEADVIFFNGAKGVYYDNAMAVYNKTHNTSETKGEYSNSNDISFANVIQIYDRIVAKEDAAFIGSKNCTNGNNIETNVQKLFCMLFYVNKGGEIGGSARTMFMDYLKSYVDSGRAPSISKYACSNSYNGLQEENGFMFQDFPWETDPDKAITNAYYDSDGNQVIEYGNNPEEHIEAYDQVGQGDANRKYYNEISDDWPVTSVNSDGSKNKSYTYTRSSETKYKYNPATKKYEARMYKSKSNTTDYAYIDEETGDFVLNPKYSGYWFNVDFVFERGGFDYKTVSWEQRLNNNPYHKWPWDIEEGSCLKYWWFSSTDNRSHIPLYFHYFAWNNYQGINDPAETNYKNQSLAYENRMFQVDDLVKDAIEERKPREDEHVYVEYRNKYYKISMNVVNGDGVNKTGASGNKVIYINDYEVDDKDGLPLKFKLQTTENITSLELFRKGSSTPIESYTPSSSNDVTDSSRTLDFAWGEETDGYVHLANTTDPTERVGDAITGTPVYSYEGIINNAILKSNYTSGINNTFLFRVTIEPVPGVYRTATDTITIVVRDFYELD